MMFHIILAMVAMTGYLAYGFSLAHTGDLSIVASDLSAFTWIGHTLFLILVIVNLIRAIQQAKQPLNFKFYLLLTSGNLCFSLYLTAPFILPFLFKNSLPTDDITLGLGTYIILACSILLFGFALYGKTIRFQQSIEHNELLDDEF